MSVRRGENSIDGINQPPRQAESDLPFGDVLPLFQEVFVVKLNELFDQVGQFLLRFT